jgi:hypothetical protein
MKEYKPDMLDWIIEHYDNSKHKRFWDFVMWIWAIPDYFQYLFRKADHPHYASLNTIEDMWVRFVCRIKYHPCGAVFYNPGGDEPDPKCKECGDEIG